MRYIRQVHLEGNGTSNEHITHVRSSIGAGGALSLQSRGEIVRQIDLGTDSYRSHNDGTGDEAAVVVRVSSRGIRYIATVADQRETNNLRRLPRF